MKNYHNLSKSSKTGIKMSLAGVLGWALAIAAVEIFSLIFKVDYSISLVRFVVVPALLVFSGVIVNYYEIPVKLNIRPFFFTIALTMAHGLWAQYTVLQIPKEFNGFAMLFLFSFGLLYLKVSSGFLVTIVFSTANIMTALTLIFLLHIDIGMDEQLFLFFFGFSGISTAIINAPNRRNYLRMRNQERQIKELNQLLEKDIEQHRLKSDHVFQQIRKVFYSHQINQLADGLQLEATMPIGGDSAYVIAFDIISSSKFRRADKKNMFRDILAKCSEKAMEGYDPEKRSARAFRIKEMGDGFLCSVGFPFQSDRPEAPAESTLKLAEDFIAIMDHFNNNLDADQQLYCSVGIAYGQVEGYFTTVPPILYDLYGHGIVLATRYEQARKIIFPSSELNHHVLTLQEDVFRCLNAGQKKLFTMIDLPKQGIVIRDDEKARFAFCRIYQQVPHNERSFLTAG